jgi:hypothetical protein
MMIACVYMCMWGLVKCVGGWSGYVEWCECECVWVGGGAVFVCLCLCGRWCLHVCVVFACACVIGVCQLELERPRCGGWNCDGGRRAALDIADDIEVRVRVCGVMGCGAGSLSDDDVLMLGWACDGVGRGVRGWREVSEMRGPTWVHAGRHDDSVCVHMYVGLGEVCGWSGDTAPSYGVV